MERVGAAIKSAGPALTSPSRGAEAARSPGILGRFSSPNFTRLSPSPIVNEGPARMEPLRGMVKIGNPPIESRPNPRVQIFKQALERGRSFNLGNFRSLDTSDIKLGKPDFYNPAQKVRMFKVNQPSPTTRLETPRLQVNQARASNTTSYKEKSITKKNS